MGPTYRITANYCPLLNISYFKCSRNISRFKSKVLIEKKSDENFCDFSKLVMFRQKQAEKTVLIQLSKFDDAVACKDFCLSFGNIAHMFHYTLKTEEQHPNMVLVEYASKYAISNLLNAVKSPTIPDCVPVHTAVLQFQKNNVKLQNSTVTDLHFPKYWHSFPTLSNIKTSLKEQKTVSDQMETYSKLMQLTDFDLRLRYFTAHQLLLCFSKLFPTICILPFGSSATGLGAMGCDLDLVCTFNKNPTSESGRNHFKITSKSFSLIDRREQQDFLRSMAFLMHNFIPGVINTKTILNARVPIVKFFHIFSRLQCDLSGNNLSGFYMTEILYTFSELDPRVKPLVFTIRKWAEVASVTTESPSNKITNFSLILLIIFFLQQRCILPPLIKLFTPLGTTAINSPLSSEAIQKHMNKKTISEHSSYELLLDFFEFYATFDFSMHGICIREGKTKPKLDISPIYIYNPMESTLNVSRNVSLHELTSFIEKMISLISIMTKSTNNFTLLQLLETPSHMWTIKQNSMNSEIHQMTSSDEENQKINK